MNATQFNQAAVTLSFKQSVSAQISSYNIQVSDITITSVVDARRRSSGQSIHVIFNIAHTSSDATNLGETLKNIMSSAAFKQAFNTYLTNNGVTDIVVSSVSVNHYQATAYDPQSSDWGAFAGLVAGFAILLVISLIFAWWYGNQGATKEVDTFKEQFSMK